MYATLARLGFGVAKALRPSKLKKGLRTIGQYTTKPAFDVKKNPKLNAAEGKFINLLQSGSKKGQQLYTKGYKAALGTSTRRKVTSGVLGTYAIGKVFDDL